MKAGVLGLFLLTGCSTLSVWSDYDTHYDFSTLKTYAWLAGEPPSNDVRINNSLIINRVVNAVNSNLESKGYKLVDKDKADFYVNWFGGIENKIRQETINSYYGHLGYGFGEWGHGGYSPGYIRTYSYEYQEGTLIIDIADSKSKQLIWRGTGQEYLETKETPEKITADINQTVSGILSSFPPGNRPL
ncbi:MAG TPA: DUF4136 domain-containing protein [Gammaproteobacteria bacterium]|nr:DUF4136 domain-containing protein [Gammaproteobacteria bacterium]